MITVKEDTTLVGISELRTNIDKILEESKKHKVLIERRNKPVAVLLAMERYKQIEEILDLLEDTALGLMAKERESKSKPSDYLDIQEAEDKIKGKPR
ncbi:MAG: type II toxin-antitoxin system Phd/YefM family antitoxin [Candidatus Omnitrophica bacterium]|nr:type II toxin-antitoxin system Phd/YefM family antitoxin [Candidatus Omnitrophota bacterium]